MSKAFTSEETEDAPPVTRPAPAGGRVTPEGASSLRDEASRERALGNVERAAFLEATVAALTVARPHEGDDVGFGSWVTVVDDGGKEFTWRIVGAAEVDPKRGLVSVDSPVGKALLRRRVGDVVEVARPGGDVRLEVVKIRR